MEINNVELSQIAKKLAESLKQAHNCLFDLMEKQMQLDMIDSVINHKEGIKLMVKLCKLAQGFDSEFPLSML